MHRIAWVVIVITASLSAGCAASLSATRRAHVVPKGKFEITAGYGINVPVGAIVTLVTEGKEAAKGIQYNDGKPTIDEKSAVSLATAAAAILVEPPAPVAEFNLRYGLIDRMDVGLRYAGSTLRAEAFGQIIDKPWGLSGGIGLARHTFDSSLLSLLGDLHIAEYKRTDLDAALLYGREWMLGAFYFGPKFMYSHYSGDGLLVKDNQIIVKRPDGTGEQVVALDLSHSFTYGGLVGGRLGYKYVFFTAELGIYGSTFKPVVLGQRKDLGGLIVYPSFGVVVNF
jgi:hypothetical protein